MYKTCEDCIHFLGFGDFGLCCEIKYDLCYEDTPACDDFYDEDEFGPWN